MLTQMVKKSSRGRRAQSNSRVVDRLVRRHGGATQSQQCIFSVAVTSDNGRRIHVKLYLFVLPGRFKATLMKIAMYGCVADPVVDQSRGSQPGSEAHRMPRSGSMSAGNQAPAAPNYGLRDHLGDGFQQLLKQSRPRGFLPDYIRGLPQRFQPEDIEYLATKGALTVPEPELRNALLKAYIHYVHPFMPLLDLEDFLVTIARNDGVRRLSLLLFQAVMFAGTAFVDMEHLQKAGYHNRKMARKIFFQRARVCELFIPDID